MKLLFATLFFLIKMHLCAQTENILWHNEIWPDTVFAENRATDTLDSLDQYYYKEKKSLAGFDLYWYMEGLYLIKKQGNKFIRAKLFKTYDYGQGIFFDDYFLKDINGDGISEIVIHYHFEFREFHWHDGWSYENYCIAFIDTSTMAVLFNTELKYKRNETYVTYFDEDKQDENDAEWDRKIKSAENINYELEYVLRYKGNAIELVYSKLIVEDKSFKAEDIPNRGITKYKWEKDKWIKLL